jgi:hypothetical protein
MIATVVLADGSTETVVVPGSGRFDVKADGELFILGTDTDGTEIGSRYLAPGTWLRASFDDAGPGRPFASVTAPVTAPEPGDDS